MNFREVFRISRAFYFVIYLLLLPGQPLLDIKKIMTAPNENMEAEKSVIMKTYTKTEVYTILRNKCDD